jgi:site-specific DNA-methyltransferase (cytosine-N4-specific)
MPDSSKESRIPVGTQFSPNTINLKAYAEMAVKYGGDPDKLREVVVDPPVRAKPYSKEPTRRMRGLPLEAGKQYGLFEGEDYNATELAKRLANTPEPEIYDVFARHILLNKGGLRVVEAAQEMELDGLNVTGDTLARYLTDQGFRVTVHNTAINTMRMWLGKAGVFPESGRVKNAWVVDRERKAELLQLDDDQIGLLADLTEQQRAFVRALCRLDPKGWYQANNVRDLAEGTMPVRFDRSSLPKYVLKPLEETGIIEFRTKGTSGGKSSELRTTDAFKTEILKPFVENTIDDLDGALTRYYRKRPEDIFEALASSNAHRKGEALEAFSVYIMRLLGLRFIGWRKRASSTAYGEIDVLMSGMFGGLATTWQVQCKNTPSSKVSLEDIAKEVGLLPVTNATHILFIANSDFTSDARDYADAMMTRSPVGLYLLGKEDFESIKDDPGSIGHILKREARRVDEIQRRAPVWGGISQTSENTDDPDLFSL